MSRTMGSKFWQPVFSVTLIFDDARFTAAVTAPQRVCPTTRISFAPATAQPYSMLPSTLGLVTFPATRTLKISPRPMSKIISEGVRESMQESTMAIGCWPCAVPSSCRVKSRVSCLPVRKRSFPSRRI